MRAVAVCACVQATFRGGARRERAQLAVRGVVHLGSCAYMHEPARGCARVRTPCSVCHLFTTHLLVLGQGEPALDIRPIGVVLILMLEETMRVCGGGSR